MPRNTSHMEISRRRKRIAQVLVVVGWILLVVTSFSIGQFQGKVPRDQDVEKFVVNPDTSTLGPFFGYMFAVLLLTSPSAMLGLVAWFLADLRSAKVLAIVGLCVVLFALIYNLMP